MANYRNSRAVWIVIGKWRSLCLGAVVLFDFPLYSILLADVHYLKYCLDKCRKYTYNRACSSLRYLSHKSINRALPNTTKKQSTGIFMPILLTFTRSQRLRVCQSLIERSTRTIEPILCTLLTLKMYIPPPYHLRMDLKMCWIFLRHAGVLVVLRMCLVIVHPIRHIRDNRYNRHMYICIYLNKCWFSDTQLFLSIFFLVLCFWLYFSG